MDLQCECGACQAVRELSDDELKAELDALINELSRREQKVLYIVEIKDKKIKGVSLQ